VQVIMARRMTSTELRPGLLIDAGVRLVRLVGEGGMGSVWVADHLRLGTQVAVKFLSPQLAKESASIVRFQHEAMSAAQIKSPHVVQVFDHGVFAGERPYIVMELLEGEDLAQRLERTGPLSLLELARLVVHVCRALRKAHAAGIVHRDIKPGNVFVSDQDGELFAKVLDFGIARRADAAVSTAVTDVGSMVGTPLYMSPEQMIGHANIDFRTDLWSLGVLAYYSLVGRVPFEGVTVGAVCMAIERGTFEPPSRARPGTPRAIDAWFLKALSRDPATRFGSARQMADAFVAATGVTPADSLRTTISGGSRDSFISLADGLLDACSRWSDPGPPPSEYPPPASAGAAPDRISVMPGAGGMLDRISALPAPASASDEESGRISVMPAASVVPERISMLPAPNDESGRISVMPAARAVPDRISITPGATVLPARSTRPSAFENTAPALTKTLPFGSRPTRDGRSSTMPFGANAYGRLPEGATSLDDTVSVVKRPVLDASSSYVEALAYSTVTRRDVARWGAFGVGGLLIGAGVTALMSMMFEGPGLDLAGTREPTTAPISVAAPAPIKGTAIADAPPTLKPQTPSPTLNAQFNTSVPEVAPSASPAAPPVASAPPAALNKKPGRPRR
jgi:serine/threonine protein kinase